MGMPQEGLGVWRDFSRAVLEVGGLEGRGRNIDVGETNIWVFLGLVWMFGGGREQRQTSSGTGHSEGQGGHFS